MREKILAVEAFLWALRARMPARGVLTAFGLLASLPWTTFDSRDDERNPDRGVSIAYIAQQCSMSPRTVYRALHGGGKPEHEAFEAWSSRPEKERTLDAIGRPRRARLDPKLSLVGLGIVTVERDGREGRPSHYRFNPLRAQELGIRAQRQVLDHIDARDERNAGKRPGEPGYEPPAPPRLPSAEDVARDDRAVPRWIDPDVDDRAGMYAAIEAIEHELYGVPTDAATQRASNQRHPGLHEPVLDLWRERGCPAWTELADDVVRYTRTVRACRNEAILTGWRGYKIMPGTSSLGTPPWWKQVNKDWTQVNNLKPARFLTAKRVAQGLSIAELHDDPDGQCGCGKHASTSSGSTSWNASPSAYADLDAEAEPGTVLSSILGPTTDEDAAVTWTRIRAGLKQQASGRDIEIWTSSVIASVEEGVLVLDVSNHYFADYLIDAGIAAVAGCAVRFVQRRA